MRPSTALRVIENYGGYQIWPLLLLTACVGPSGTPIPVSQEGVALALACGASHGLQVKHPLETLRFETVPSLGEYKGHLLAELGEGRRGWIREDMTGYPRVWAHLALHLLYDLPGYGLQHPAIFAACNLDPL